MWRLDSYWRVEEKDGGVYVQNETVALSRTVPAILAWLVNPLLKSVPRTILAHLLTDTRNAVTNAAFEPPQSVCGSNPYFGGLLETRCTLMNQPVLAQD